MKRSLRTISLAALAAVLSLPLLAQDHPGGMGGHHGRPGGHLMRCLRDAGLSDSQKADIKAIFEAAKPTIQADAQAMRAARQKLNTDFDAGADKSVLGQDYAAVRAAGKKLHDDGQAIQDQVLGKLNTDQKSTVQNCLAAHGPGGRNLRSSEE
jgi:Spy/CpxP family protein refolding chaperone